MTRRGEKRCTWASTRGRCGSAQKGRLLQLRLSGVLLSLPSTLKRFEQESPQLRLGPGPLALRGRWLLCHPRLVPGAACQDWPLLRREGEPASPSACLGWRGPRPSAGQDRASPDGKPSTNPRGPFIPRHEAARHRDVAKDPCCPSKQAAAPSGGAQAQRPARRGHVQGLHVLEEGAAQRAWGQWGWGGGHATSLLRAGQSRVFRSPNCPSGGREGPRAPAGIGLFGAEK